MTDNRTGPGFDPEFDPDDDDLDLDGQDIDDVDIEDLDLDGEDIDRDRAEEMASEMAAVQAQIAKVPAATVVANHAMGLYELGAIHLSQQPPNFTEASLAIDAFAALIDRLAGRLGAEEETLRQLLNGLRLAFIQLKDRAAQV